MHAFPNDLKKQLAVASAILGVFLFRQKVRQFLSDARRAPPALVHVIENVAIRIGGRECGDRNGKVAAKAGLAAAMLALQTGVANGTVLDLAAAADAVLLAEKAELHLVQQGKQIVRDQLAVLRKDQGMTAHHHDRSVGSHRQCCRGHSPGWRRRNGTGGSGEANARGRVHHAQSAGRFLPVLAASTRPRPRLAHEFHHGDLGLVRNVLADERMPSLPRFNRVINVLERRRKTNGAFLAHRVGPVLAMNALNAHLAHDNAAAVRFAVARRRHVLRGRRKGFHAVAAHKTVQQRERLFVFVRQTQGHGTSVIERLLFGCCWCCCCRRCPLGVIRSGAAVHGGVFPARTHGGDCRLGGDGSGVERNHG